MEQARSDGGTTVREAVGVFSDARQFEDAIDELLSAGFDRAEISLLATPEAVEEKLGERYQRAEALEDDPNTPRVAYVEREAVGAGEGMLAGSLAYIPAVTAAGAVVASGGTLAPAVAAAAAAGGAGGAVGAVLARWLGRRHGDYIQQQLERGGLLLWVRTRDAEHERKAADVLNRHGARDVHIHDIPAASKQPGPPGV